MARRTLFIGLTDQQTVEAWIWLGVGGEDGKTKFDLSKVLGEMIMSLELQPNSINKVVLLSDEPAFRVHCRGDSTRMSIFLEVANTEDKLRQFTSIPGSTTGEKDSVTVEVKNMDRGSLNWDLVPCDA